MKKSKKYLKKYIVVAIFLFKKGTKEVVYYGFAIEGNTVFCREAYKSADGVLAHLGDVKASLDKAVVEIFLFSQPH